MSPLLKTSGRRSASPRETREYSFNDVVFAEQDNHSPPAMSSWSPQARPLTVAIPDQFKAQGAYCPRRPNLSEILANQSPPPWTLSAFMAYLSHNHCLETLEFTMDAKRYRQHFDKVSSRSPGGQIQPGSEQSEHMNGLWQRLMQAYIQPNGIREVNLPSDVRDGLLSQDTSLLPPHPDTLHTAIEKVHELMEESVLVPFLNSLFPQTAQPDSNSSSAEDLTNSGSYDERSLFRSRTKKIRRRGSPLSASPPLSSSTPSTSASPPVLSPSVHHRASAPSAITQFARTLSHSARHGMQIPHSNSLSPRPLSGISAGLQSGPTSGFPDLTPSPPADYNSMSMDTDLVPPPLQTHSMDSTSTPSPSGDPMTPPTTPPAGDMGSSPVSAGGPAGRGNPWKRMRYSFGWRKKPDQHDLENL
ncbi:regulator of G protein signaling superfamily [Microthyrium microscopicum]|uniref:Regulator of G protein signaling superfamily n=1 Tax=Microthyrium microscopicum TaxID=703497 RepID=A0A6A6U322_9PEZI|nr:regulator of G protein signaling superfamily [Microthyrium microscopicum]